MKAEAIERLYQKVVYGREEPGLAYLSGKTLKEMSAMWGDPITEDKNGNPIIDGALYCMMAGEGVFRVE